MTLSQIILLACRKVNRNNEQWREEANEYAQNRAEFIWNFHDWEDSMALGTKTVAIGEQETLLDTTVEKCIRIKWDNSYNLDHLPLNRLFEFSADIFSTNGSPCAFINLPKDDDGVRGIRLFHAPQESKTLLYLAKKKFTEIGINDELPLTAMNNCLLSFVIADLWQKARQFDDADRFLTEGMAMLKTMKANEQEQSGLQLEIQPDTTYSGEVEEIW